jgi:hypothetical protein
MSHHISNAANIIQSRYTGPVLPFNDSEDQQAVIEVPRDQYLVWMRNEMDRSRTKFILCISGPRSRLNNDFSEKYGVHQLANDYVPPVAPVVESVGVKRGRPTGDNFKEVIQRPHLNSEGTDFCSFFDVGLQMSTVQESSC